jgi:hypothetical protein
VIYLRENIFNVKKDKDGKDACGDKGEKLNVI